MEDFINPSPFDLKNTNPHTSPFAGNSFELGVGLNFDDKMSEWNENEVFDFRANESKWHSHYKNIFTKESDKKDAANEQQEQEKNKTRKRINDFDGNILSKYSTGEEDEKLTFRGHMYKIFKERKFEFNIENIKNIRNIKNIKLEDVQEFFYTLFPGVYKSQTMRGSVEKLVALNKIANDLVTKTIPYGEQQEHYKDLIESLSMATNIQADLKRKIS